MDKSDFIFIDGNHMSEYFYSLVRKSKAKSRTCLGARCKKSFVSKGHGNRFCSYCAEKNKRVPDKHMSYKIEKDPASRAGDEY